MKISVKLIYEQLCKKWQELELTGDGMTRIEEIRFLDSAGEIPSDEDEEAILYIVTVDNFAEDELSKADFPKQSESLKIDKCNFLHKGNTASVPGIRIPESSSVSVSEAANEILRILHRFSEWAYKTETMIRCDADISDILGAANEVTPDTLWLSDSSLKNLAYSKPTLMDEVSAIWRYQTTYGYLPINIVYDMMGSGELNRIQKIHGTFVCDSGSLNLPYICHNIYNRYGLISHLFIIHIYDRPNQTNLEVAEFLGNLLADYLEKHPELVSRASGFHSAFFKDVLERRLVDEWLIKNQLTCFNWKIEDRYLLLVLDSAQNTKAGKNCIIAMMNKGRDFDCQTFENEAFQFVLFHEPDKNKLCPLLEPIAERFRIPVVMSREFHSLMDLPSQYEQCLQILKISKGIQNSGWLIHNDDLGIYRLVQILLEQHTPTELCQENVLRLYALDQANHTEYLHTLYVYLSNHCNVLRTSKALFIHRNTLNYRLEKIRKYIDPEKIEPEMLHYILFSIYLLEESGRKSPQ